MLLPDRRFAVVIEKTGTRWRANRIARGWGRDVSCAQHRGKLETHIRVRCTSERLASIVILRRSSFLEASMLFCLPSRQTNSWRATAARRCRRDSVATAVADAVEMTMLADESIFRTWSMRARIYVSVVVIVFMWGLNARALAAAGNIIIAVVVVVVHAAAVAAHHHMHLRTLYAHLRVQSKPPRCCCPIAHKCAKHALECLHWLISDYNLFIVHMNGVGAHCGHKKMHYAERREVPPWVRINNMKIAVFSECLSGTM